MEAVRTEEGDGKKTTTPREISAVSCKIREGAEDATLMRTERGARYAYYDSGEKDLGPQLIYLDWCDHLQMVYESLTMQDLTDLRDIATVVNGKAKVREQKG